ncbi:putative T6SS immunity periplasmic lipoprotein [Kosakonia sp. BYX6]|uniref:T6SS immunity periplasmic lipoprotein n=1 Tax=Kosakonia calanthes TaxID=3139408 RepID=A0ABZ3B789_9ENTR
MKKYFSLFLPLFLAGCPVGDRINMRPAQSTVVNNQICIVVNQPDAGEKIIGIGIWDYSTVKYAYEKSYASAPILLESGECIPGIDHFAFKDGNAYNITVRTGLRSYEARFTVAMQGKNIALQDMNN